MPLYLVFFPASAILYHYKMLPEGYFVWFIVLAAMEHVSTEINRLLNIMQMQLYASVVLFFRSSAWVVFMLPLMYAMPQFRTLDTLLWSWLIGVVISIIFGIYSIFRSLPEWRVYIPSYTWMLKGYKIGMLFILGTLAFQAISTMDKFLIKIVSGIDIVGIYVFYMSLTVGASAVIHAGVIVFSTPPIVAAFQNRQVQKAEKLMSRFLTELLVSVTVMVVVLFALMPYVVSWVGKTEYIKYYEVFYLIMGTAVIIVMNSHPSTYLYANKHDLYILYSNISSFIVFLLLSGYVYLFDNIGYGTLYEVAGIVLLTQLWLLIVKYIGYVYYYRKKYRENHEDIGIY